MTLDEARAEFAKHGLGLEGKTERGRAFVCSVPLDAPPTPWVGFGAVDSAEGGTISECIEALVGRLRERRG